MPLVDVKVPDLGGHDAVPVIEVLVKDGDTIEQEQVLLVLESDKATMEVPSPAAGIVRGLKVKVGDKLGVGAVICQLDSGGGEAPAAGAAPQDGAKQPPAPTARQEDKAAEGKPPVPPGEARVEPAQGAPVPEGEADTDPTEGDAGGDGERSVPDAPPAATDAAPAPKPTGAKPPPGPSGVPQSPPPAQPGTPAEAAAQRDGKTVAAPDVAEAKPQGGQDGGAPASLAVTVPDIGGFKDVPVIEVLVAEGATVAKDAPMLVLESDKSTMEVPAPADGTVRGLKVKVGDKVSQGSPVCSLETAAGGDGATVSAPPQGGADPAPPTTGGDGPTGTPALSENAPDRNAGTPLPPGEADAQAAGEGGGSDAKPSAGAGAPTPIPKVESQSTAAPAPKAEAHAGPATRKFARELGVDLAQVKGTGAKDRVTVEDVQAHVKTRLQAPPPAPAAAGAAPVAQGSGIPPIPAQDFAQFGPVETKPLARIRKLSAAHLSRAWLNVPHVTQFEEADITELEAFRKAMNEETPATKLTLLPFLMKAVGAALKAFPEFNSSLAPAGDALVLKGYCHLGFAADTPNGLVVPVVKNVWDKGIAQLAAECGELAKKARDGKLKPDEMRGGCFSISSLGGLGVAGHFTPIVNAPEVGILGVSKAVQKPVWDGATFVPKLMLPLSLSYDHRVIDGAYAARFTVALVRLIADLRRLVL